MPRKKKTDQPSTEAPKASAFDTKRLQAQIQEHVRQSGGTAAVGGQDFIQQILKSAFEAMLEAEMDEHLGYKKHEKGKSEGNARNGRGKKKIRGDFGELELNPPRDRQGEFEPKIIPKRKKDVGMFTEKIVSLYARGMTTREIEEHLKELYNIEISPTFISRATDRLSEDAREWQQRPLERLYAVVYMDGISYKVRDPELRKVVRKTVYICLGVDVEGRQDVLGLYIAASEAAHVWLSVLSDLKERGVKDILIACVDGLTGFPDAIRSAFPETDVQLCVVHQIRNSAKHVPYKRKEEFCKDLRQVYSAPSIQAADAQLKALEDKWGKNYPLAVRSWRRDWEHISTFLHYPSELRRLIYTTNTIEALNRQLRKNTKTRGAFPSDEALLKLLYFNIERIVSHWIKRINWPRIMTQLDLLFGDRIRQ